MARYNLGAVKDHVAKVANTVGPKYGIKTIYGWAPGVFDHPKGLALDFMINNISNGRDTGDKLSAFVIANYKALGVKYVIWYRRYWDPRQGWKAYSAAASSPHTDHVHVSFETKPGSGTIEDTKDGTDSTAVPTQLGWITDTGNWARIGYVAFGMVLIFIGIINIPAVQNTMKGGGKLAVAVASRGVVKL